MSGEEEKLRIPWPVSGGVILSYKCTSECGHCMYASSPKWTGDWMSLNLFEKVLRGLGPHIRMNSPWRGVSMNYGLHFTGGEPFLNYELLLKMVEVSYRHGLHSNFAETNCFWCTDDEVVERRFRELRSSGLGGILVSVNPFVAEFVPLENMERAIRAGQKVFDRNLMVYHPTFYGDLKRLGIKGKIRLIDYLKIADEDALYSFSDSNVLLPMGRLVWRFSTLFRNFPLEYFLRENCLQELTRPWHVHVDNYGNYISGYCAGISLGKYDGSHIIFREGVNLADHAVIAALSSSLGDLYRYAVKEYHYEPREAGYVSKCHLCLDVRKRLVDEGCDLRELNPRQFYNCL